MKHIALVLLSTVIGVQYAEGQSQHALDRAIAIKLNGPGGPGLNFLHDTTITVPNGKVWKLESIAMGTTKDFTWSGGVIYTPYQADCYVTLEGNVISPALPAHLGLQISPIWLPPGSYLLELWQENGQNAIGHKALISILEFSQ